jgi:hypothetical protein
MAIYDYLPKFNYIEPNNLKGLQPGFVVAQEGRVAKELCKEVNGKFFFENGKLCALSADGIVAATGDEHVVLIHFTEPLNTIRNSDQYFAVEMRYNEEGKADLDATPEYPRLVQLIAGDEWMSTEDLGDEILGGRIVKVAKAEKGWFAVDYMANGDKAYHYVFLG